MEGPFKSAFDALDTKGVVLHELITYQQRDGMMVKKIVTRQYSENGDYTDSIIVQPLVIGSNV
jgi:hypothetical protein